MGSSKSKPITPNNPLQELQLKEILRDQKLKKKEKEQKNLRKIQEKNVKKQLKHQKHQKPNGRTVNEPPPIYDLNQQEYELKIEQSLRYQLDNDLCGFILNQTSFTLQFFGNFEREISAAYEYIWKQKENHLNQKFEDHSILMANALDAAVERRVKYKPVHGLQKYQLQPLQAQTMYVVFENIDIARPNEANYDSLSPICKVDMETDFYKTTPCSEEYASVLKDIKWKGYVRLKLRDTAADSTPKAVAAQKPLFNDEGIYFASESTISSSSKRKSEVRNSNSSGYTSGPEYDYAYITHLNSHHPLAELTMSNINEKAKVDAKILPESCIANLQDFIEIRDDDEDEEEEEQEGYEFDGDDPSNTDESNNRKFQLPQIKYLDSKEFMRYFGDLLRKKLAPKLGLTAADFENGTYRGASIHTQACEIIPAIHVAHNAQNWPDCAFQFKRRERPTRTNPLTRKQFQWPTQEMIKRIETFGFHVIPLGYAPKRKRNPYREIEWKIIFPKAERFLETTLTNTQIKVFMIAKALVKAFVEPQEKDNTLMFTIDHLRMHLFWECERNYVTWPEEYIGDVLLRFIRSFMHRLRIKSLPDFFIQGRNLFESIPEYSLMRLHDALAEIVANPVMHLIVALRNLHFVDDFIPKMDFKKIYNNLVENNYLKLKTLSRNAKSIAIVDDSGPSYQADEDADIQGLIGYSQQKDKGKGQLRRRTLMLKHNIEMRRRLDYEKSRRSVDSIDLEFVFTKNLKDSEKKKDYNQGVENLRRTNILEIILENLIAMGEACIGDTESRSIYLARIYLNQAKRLCKFYSNYGCDMGAIEFISQIETIESQIAILRNTESNIPPPALPIRTSLEPVKSFRTKDLEAKEPKGNLYIRQVSRAKSESPKLDIEPRRSIKFSNPFEANPSMQVRADVHRPVSMKTDEELQSPREQRRSIKFSDEAPSPTQIFRFDDEEVWPSIDTQKTIIPNPPTTINGNGRKTLKPSKPHKKSRRHSESSDSETDYDEPKTPPEMHIYENGHWKGSRPVAIERQLDSANQSPSQRQCPSAIYRFEIRSSPTKGISFTDSIRQKHQRVNSKEKTISDLEVVNPVLHKVDAELPTPKTILRLENGKPDTGEDLTRIFPSTLSSSSSIQVPTTFEKKRALIKQMLQHQTDSIILVKGINESDTSEL